MIFILVEFKENVVLRTNKKMSIQWKKVKQKKYEK